MQSREVASTAELRRACEDDGLLIWAAQDFAPGVRAWRRGEAVAVACPYLSCRDRLTVRGPVHQVAALLREILPEVGPTYRPTGDAALVAALADQVPDLRVARTLGWMECTGPARGTGEPAGTAADRPLVAGDRRPRWLAPREWSQVAELLFEALPHSHARPGLAGVRRWAGAHDVDGALAAVAADAWTAPGIGYLAGVATRPSARRQGHGATAFRLALDALVAEEGRAALMVAPDNHAARTLYARLGMTWRDLGAACVAVRSSAA